MAKKPKSYHSMKKNLSAFVGLMSFVFFLSCGNKQVGGFELLDSDYTNIHFQNTIKENDSVNVFKFMNIYTGAGVAVGDINNDGLTDVYFSGNMVSGKLYMNKGGMQFEDITEASGLTNTKWGTGVTMVDINQDGWLDIYVCVSGGAIERERANLLYVNNGPSTNTGQVTFTEKALEYGLADTRQSMHAAFFDYDRDNDLDMYLLVNPAAYEYKVNISTKRILDGTSISNDRLYRNNGDGSFTDITLEAGILVEGYGLGVGISDINNDQWPDVYVSNDFIGNDILYINKGDGTFKDELTDFIDHSSYAGMGNDVADIDNNGKPDIMVLDMRPEDNFRQKLIISSTGYDRFQTMLNAGYAPQYSRNTLQLNQGNGKFSEIGFLAGVSSTDWSWSALLADYDNDGYKDLYVTNGFFRDLGDLDYIHYQGTYDNPLGEREVKIQQKRESIEELPQASLPNYVYKNSGGMTFTDMSEQWNVTQPSCSNGAAYADFDNDGDLDLVVNNVDRPAFVLKNNSVETQKNQNYLKLALRGSDGNIQGIGTKITVYADGKQQHYEHFLSRGYESSVDQRIHFGLGNARKVDSLHILWPNGKWQILKEIEGNQELAIAQKNAVHRVVSTKQNMKTTWFKDVTDSLGILLHHVEDDMVDFKLQPILPHMHSRGGPSLAVADIDGDGLDDFYIGGAAGHSAILAFQNEAGLFDTIAFPFHKEREDMGALFFDADKDGDQDLYVVSGGVLKNQTDEEYQDRFYLNDGSGQFQPVGVLPKMNGSGAVVTAADYDKDGDLDLFVGGRVRPGEYPLAPKSYLLQNTSTDGKIGFKDVSHTVAEWEKIGMVSAALWTDYNDDGWQDLIISGEFMPITVFQNQKGAFVNTSKNTGLEKSHGWWNSIASGDFDNDGDTDYILGNQGLNTKYRVSENEPLCIYAKDYDNDGRIDPIMCYYIDGENYLAHGRDEIISQISAMRVRFRTYRSYAETPFERSFLKEELEDAYVVKSHMFESSYLQNLGNGRFELRPLPLECQVAPVQGILVKDFDGDGKLDALLTGNAYGTEVASGRQDALKGLMLQGDGNGNFIPLKFEESGFINDHDGSALAMLQNNDGYSYVLSANSDGPLKVFKLKQELNVLKVEQKEVKGHLYFKNGAQQKVEFQYGNGYLSQSSRSLFVPRNTQKITVTDTHGKTRTIYESE